LKKYVDWKEVTGNFDDQFEVIFGLEQIIGDDGMT
jgi:hypothetical protein